MIGHYELKGGFTYVVIYRLASNFVGEDCSATATLEDEATGIEPMSFLALGPEAEAAAVAAPAVTSEEAAAVAAAVAALAALVTSEAAEEDEEAAAAAVGCSLDDNLCLTTRLAVPSLSFFIKFQASILDIRVQSVLLTEIISSPTFNVPFLSAAPPVKIFLIVSGLSPSGESLPPSKLNPKPVPSFFKITVTGDPRGTSTNFKSDKRDLLSRGLSKIFGGLPDELMLM